MPVEPNHVYVISPAFHIEMLDGYLRVSEPRRENGRHIAIDLFFRTLADAHREKSMAVVLTGTGSDGAAGLPRVKEQGGVTLVQSPGDAEYDAMPTAAIASGAADFVLPLAEIPQKLLDLWEHMQRIQLPADAMVLAPIIDIDSVQQLQASDEALREIIVSLRLHTGHDFTYYKRATMLRRIERRMQVNKIETLPLYRDYLHGNAAECKRLLDDLLIGVTNFFRDREAFEALERDVLPELFHPNGTAQEQVRVWSVGCSSGEETYSLAMLLAEYVDLAERSSKIQVFGTDIDERGLAVGRAAVYSEAIVTEIPPIRLQRYFTRVEERYLVKKEIRENVLFAVHNVLRDPPFSRIDLIVCRNLLIYLERAVQEQVLQTFHFALSPGGYLFLGNSESADLRSDLFEVLDKKNRIYRVKGAAPPERGVIRDFPRVTPIRRISTVSVKEPKNDKVTYALLHQRMLEQYAPPSIMVTHDSTIVHIADRAGHFLRYTAGEPSHNLLAAVLPELRLALRTALFQAVHTGNSVEARRVSIEREGRRFYVNMVARPFKHEQQEFVLVLFDQVEEALSQHGHGSDDADAAAQGDRVLVQLEEELERTKAQLQEVVEQSETSTEELKASNEELQAINEELRSATEELEVSKEELQSINEELITVNQELKSKYEETSKINDDLQNLISSTDIATVFIDRGMRIKWYTPRATDIFNIIPSDRGRSLLDITHRLAYDSLASDAERAFETLRTMEVEISSNDGRWYIARVSPYRTSKDVIDGAVLAFVDITERRRVQDRLRVEEERMRLVAASTADYAIITFDPDGYITSWNLGAQRIFGYGELEMLGSYGDILFLPEDRAAGRLQSELATARERGSADDECWMMRKDGSRFYCSGVVTLLSAGELRGYAKIARDVTHSKRRDDATRAELSKDRHRNKMKDEFFAIMSHELKHPLSLIQLNAELIGRYPATQQAPLIGKAADAILSSVRSQARIIDDLLDLSRLSTGKLKLERVPVVLRDVVERTVETIRSDSENRGVHLVVEAEDGALQPIVVDADAVRVEQILSNLLSNALKFTPASGSICIRVRRDAEFGILDVKDTGQGIDAEALPRLFDMFSQFEENKPQRQKHGLGIGLALVRQLAETHGGKAKAHSDGIGKGATFTVSLPLCDYGARDAAVREIAKGCLSGVKVLVVDDSQDIGTTLSVLLEMEGMQVKVATGGHAALEALQQDRYDILLSDIEMPGMSGLELLKRLRADDVHAALPIVALTGYGGPGDTQKMLAAGFSAHLRKPIDFNELMLVIESTVKQSSAKEDK